MFSFLFSSSYIFKWALASILQSEIAICCEIPAIEHLVIDIINPDDLIAIMIDHLDSDS